MLVGDLFERLSYGELRNLSTGSTTPGEIKAADQAAIIHYTNHALKLLYARFPHNRDYVNILMSESRNKYPMTQLYTLSVGSVPAGDRFILDSVSEPYTGNLLKIIGISYPDDPLTDENEFQDLRINDRLSSCGVELLTYNTIYLRKPIDGEVLLIEYQTTHPPLDTSIDEAEEITLHPVLEEALELKVAARVYSSMNGEENAAKAMRLNNEYEQACALVETDDLLQQTTSATNQKLSIGGYR